jgi:hypothetical protein
LENFKIWNNWSPSISTSNLQQSDSLVDQVEYHSQIVGKIINEGIHRPDHTKLIIMGHSVGGYIATKVRRVALHRRAKRKIISYLGSVFLSFRSSFFLSFSYSLSYPGKFTKTRLSWQ